MPAGGTPPLLPTTTKVGAGDKERAYVVRQNVCLKALLGVLIFVGTLSTLLIMTTYEVRVQRRNSLQGARSHREEEHASHMRVLRLSMLLQRHLEDEVHDAHVLTRYRAWLMRAVGDYQMKVLDHASNYSEALHHQLQGEGAAFDRDIDRLLHELWADVVTEGKTAQKALHNITHAIVSELRQDASEQGAYERVMEDAGEDPGMLGYHGHEIEYHGHQPFDGDREHHHHHGDGDAEGQNDDEEDPGYGHRHGEGGEGHYADDEDDEEHLAGALEALLAKLQHNDSVIHASNATVEAWEHLKEDSLRALADSEQEVDMDRIDKKIERAVAASHASVPSFNSSLYDSSLDYLGELVSKARLAPYRDELLDLLTEWQNGDTRMSVPLRRIEELIDEGVLPADVLVLRGDYEHYRYDGED